MDAAPAINVLLTLVITEVGYAVAWYGQVAVRTYTKGRHEVLVFGICKAWGETS